MTGEDLDAVRQLQQAAQRVEEALRAFPRADGEIRPSRVADEERVAGEDEPGLVGARAVDHRQAGVLRAMPRCVDRPQDDLAQLDLEAVGQRVVGVLGLCGRDGSRSGCRAPARAGRARRGGRRACGSRRRGRSRRRASPPPPARARPRTEDRRSRRRRLPRHRPGTTRTRGRRPGTAGRARDLTLPAAPAAREDEHGDAEGKGERHADGDSEPRETPPRHPPPPAPGTTMMVPSTSTDSPSAKSPRRTSSSSPGRHGGAHSQRGRSSASRRRRPPAACWRAR